MSVSLDIMHSRPGIYTVVSATIIAFVEVAHDGRVHQLKPDTLEQDGELVEGRWLPQNILGIYGPLYRTRPPKFWPSDRVVMSTRTGGQYPGQVVRVETRWSKLREPNTFYVLQLDGDSTLTHAPESKVSAAP